ncbi:MAG TPA: Fur family transcriptional regulator [Planctomycetota bacterium]|jgi:Fur family ferric uptake transcriptional regulator|nr:Fur family transcriptional regulator [Planctomycetota bacterium]
MDERLRAIENFMRSRGLRLTGPRRRVVEKLLSVRGHVAADELLELLRRDRTPVSKATVYRTLAVVSRSGLIDGHDFDRRKRLYEPMVGRAHHDHLYCIACGKVIEFAEEAIERLQDQVVARHRFTPVYHSHKIFGYCEECRDRRPRPKAGRSRREIPVQERRP